MNLVTREFLDHLKLERNYSECTINSYKEDIEIFFNYLLTIDVGFDAVDLQIIRDFLTDQISNGISKRTCRRRISCLRHFYKFLYKEKYVKDNPFEYLSPIKTEKKFPETLRENQIRKLLDLNKQRTDEEMIRDQAILETLFYCGLRASELVTLQIQDVNIRSRILSVIGKGDKQRIVPFSVECASTLDQYLKNYRLQKVRQNETMHTFFFVNTRGKQLTVRGLEYILDEVEKKTGFSCGLHPHLLRHTFATTLLDNGADLRVIQELMGHTSINSTQVYTHVSTQAMKKEYFASHPRAKKH